MLSLSFFQYAPDCCGDLEGLQRLGVGQVGADAHIDVVALLVEGELGVFGQVADVLDLVVLLTLLHKGFTASARAG